MYCKDCRFREAKEGGGDAYYHCANLSAMAEDVGQEDTEAMLIYSYNEGGLFYVGPMFGCVHFEKREE
jgi:hypothetical protein